MKTMKKIAHIAALASALVFAACGEDRSHEYYELTKESHWIYDNMKEVYLWKNEIPEIGRQTYFNTPAQFFKKLLNKEDNASFLAIDNAVEYGVKYSLMRDPLGYSPSKVYALVEYVEPGSAADAAGIERGMWISAIDGKNLSISSTSLGNGAALQLTMCRILNAPDSETLAWSEGETVTLAAAAPFTPTAMPVCRTIECGEGNATYILLNTFDGNDAASAFNAAVTSSSAQNIILDLRYNESYEIENVAGAAALFLPADKAQGSFCTLYKDIEFGTMESVPYPAVSATAENKNLYIITSAATKGVANIFVKAVTDACEAGNVTVVGTAPAPCTLLTEKRESPYNFSINASTAIIGDAEGNILSTFTPDIEINEAASLNAVYPLGDEREYILQNICEIIKMGIRPQI